MGGCTAAERVLHAKDDGKQHVQSSLKQQQLLLQQALAASKKQSVQRAAEAAFKQERSCCTLAVKQSGKTPDTLAAAAVFPAAEATPETSPPSPWRRPPHPAAAAIAAAVAQKELAGKLASSHPEAFKVGIVKSDVIKLPDKKNSTLPPAGGAAGCSLPIVTAPHLQLPLVPKLLLQAQKPDNGAGAVRNNMKDTATAAPAHRAHVGSNKVIANEFEGEIATESVAACCVDLLPTTVFHLFTCGDGAVTACTKKLFRSSAETCQAQCSAGAVCAPEGLNEDYKAGSSCKVGVDRSTADLRAKLSLHGGNTDERCIASLTGSGSSSRASDFPDMTFTRSGGDPSYATAGAAADSDEALSRDLGVSVKKKGNTLGTPNNCATDNAKQLYSQLHGSSSADFSIRCNGEVVDGATTTSTVCTKQAPTTMKAAGITTDGATATACADAGLKEESFATILQSYIWVVAQLFSCCGEPFVARRGSSSYEGVTAAQPAEEPSKAQSESKRFINLRVTSKESKSASCGPSPNRVGLVTERRGNSLGAKKESCVDENVKEQISAAAAAWVGTRRVHMQSSSSTTVSGCYGEFDQDNSTISSPDSASQRTTKCHGVCSEIDFADTPLLA